MCVNSRGLCLQLTYLRHHHVSLGLTFQNGVIPQRDRPSRGVGGGGGGALNCCLCLFMEILAFALCYVRVRRNTLVKPLIFCTALCIQHVAEKKTYVVKAQASLKQKMMLLS